MHLRAHSHAMSGSSRRPMGGGASGGSSVPRAPAALAARGRCARRGIVAAAAPQGDGAAATANTTVTVAAAPASAPASSSNTTTSSGDVQIERISTSKGSRKAASQALVRLLGLKTAPKRAIAPEELAAAPFPAYTPPFSDVAVRQKRPYLFGREWTDADAARLLFYTAMTGTAVALGPATYSPDALALALTGYVICGGLGVSLSYHRQLSHRSFKCAKPLEFFFAYCGALAFEGDPIEWAKMHAWHHRHSDTPADRHSPRDGLWHAHFGWVLDESYADSRRAAAAAAVGGSGSGSTSGGSSGGVGVGAAVQAQQQRQQQPQQQAEQEGAGEGEGEGGEEDLAAPWFYRESPEFYGWLRETYMLHMAGQAAACALLWGLPGFVWGFVIRVLLTQHMTWLVNSAVHVWGDRPYRTGDGSRNNAAVALLVFGDGWHNNHHAFPASAAHGLEWWQLDPSYYVICGLERLGLAWDVRRPSEAQKARLRWRQPSEAR